MPDYSPRDRSHFFFSAQGVTERYRRPNQSMTPQPLPARDRAAHAEALGVAMANTLLLAREQVSQREVGLATGIPGFYLGIQLAASDIALVDSLANRGQKMELVAVRPTDVPGKLLASVFMPLKAHDYFTKKIEAYRTEESQSGRPKNETVIARVETFQLSGLQSLFTDDPTLFPANLTDVVSWEVWLRDHHRGAFETLCDKLDIELGQKASIQFREREVMLATCSAEKLERLIAHSDVVAELRKAKDTPAFFMLSSGAEQRLWSDDLASRVTPVSSDDVAVCLLDSGVHRAHPLLTPSLSNGDCHTVNPAWGTDDSHAWSGHGTRMAGLALYGDLQQALTTADPLVLSHRLESVRVLPATAQEANKPELYGEITQRAIVLAEYQAPLRRRVIAMAITADTPVTGRPSSWSAAVDQLCYDEANPRLLLLSAGNIRDGVAPHDYPDRNDTEAVEDPAQAWNALTVGAFTDLAAITSPDFAGYTALAPLGELSPRSRTSVSWERQWPIKPDVVFEGGNLAYSASVPPDNIDDLQLLTTHYQPAVRPFTTFGDTSAATALASHMAASIMADRPGIWVETVRALVIHSAEWTPAMQARIDACAGGKARIGALTRRYGYGVPDLSRALRSARNDLSLVVEDAIQPFHRAVAADGTTNPSVTLREMKLHQFPWPTALLTDLGSVGVEMRVTLSYFVEPNPGERGWTRRHRYASHGLRFRVKASTETLPDFRARINQVARDEEEGASSNAGSEEWLLGTLRDHGSVHSDIWRGSAIDLASRDAVGIFPVGGWWKEKVYLDRFSEKVRYALIVTIRVPDVDIDIYTEVQTAVSAMNAVEIAIPS